MCTDQFHSTHPRSSSPPPLPRLSRIEEAKDSKTCICVSIRAKNWYRKTVDRARERQRVRQYGIAVIRFIGIDFEFIFVGQCLPPPREWQILPRPQCKAAACPHSRCALLPPIPCAQFTEKQSEYALVTNSQPSIYHSPVDKTRGRSCCPPQQCEPQNRL